MASSSCKPEAARLINNTPRVVALSWNEAWRSGGSAATRGVLFISRLSVLCQNNIVFNIEKFQMLSDNGPILTLASSARWLAQTVRFNFRGRGRAPSPSPFSKINLRRFFQSTPDLGNEPIELAQILHAAPMLPFDDIRTSP